MRGERGEDKGRRRRGGGGGRRGEEEEERRRRGGGGGRRETLKEGKEVKRVVHENVCKSVGVITLYTQKPRPTTDPKVKS